MRYERLLAISERHQKLMALIRSGAFSAPSLAEKLGVSEQTIYRDITSLRERGQRICAVKLRDAWAYQITGEPTSTRCDTRSSLK